MDKLKCFEIFVRTVQQQSFSGAARQLGMSPSGVSKAIDQLESHLATRLFQRTTRSLNPTPEGLLLFERVQELLDEVAQVELSVQQTQATPQGKLRVDLSLSLARLYLVQRLPEFMARYPAVELTISLSDRFVDLVEEGIDLTVRVGPGPDSQLVMHHLGQTRFITCASPSYLARSGIPQTPDDLASHTCLNFVFPHTGQEFSWRWRSPIESRINAQLKSDDSIALRDMALAGAGVIQVPGYIVADAIADGRLVALLEDFASLERLPIAIIYPQKRHLSAKVQVFVEFMTHLATDLRTQGFII